jgi:hypothetical protein
MRLCKEPYSTGISSDCILEGPKRSELVRVRRRRSDASQPYRFVRSVPRRPFSLPICELNSPHAYTRRRKPRDPYSKSGKSSPRVTVSLFKSKAPPPGGRLPAASALAAIYGIHGNFAAPLPPIDFYPSGPDSGVADDAPVAQLDRAAAFEAAGREFESLRARHISQQLSNLSHPCTCSIVVTFVVTA